MPAAMATAENDSRLIERVGRGDREAFEQRTKNLKPLLERAASDGYTAFATVSSGATREGLEVKQLS